MTKRTPKKNGRPSIFSEDLADEICERLSDGESLRSICRDDAMPGTSTVCRWLAENTNFREQYVISRELQADALFDDIVDIADGKNSEEPDVARDRLSVDARKWVASKLNSKKYGDKIQHAGDGGGPLTITIRDLTQED